MNKKLPIGKMLLTLSVTVGLAGCGGNQAVPVEDKQAEAKALSNLNMKDFPIVKEKLTLNIAGFKPPSGKDLNEYKFFQDVESKTNIHINWNLTPGSNWQEKRTCCLPAGNCLTHSTRMVF